MPIVKTAIELGQSIRTRRKALGWDQALLAERIGVSRQWVIDIEKGKPRAELEKVLRALDVLGVEVYVTSPVDSPESRKTEPFALVVRSPGTFDINAIVERHQSPSRRALFVRDSQRNTNVEAQAAGNKAKRTP